MKHAVIVGHPNPKSFNLAMAETYVETARAYGDEVVLRDLYAIGFDPRLASEEIPRPEGFAPSADVLIERKLIDDVDIFALVYPIWFMIPPAILTGYIQRVFGMGFGYGPIHGGGNEPLLSGRKLVSFTSSGAPREWVKSEGPWSGLYDLFDKQFAAMCGMSVFDHVHFGRVSSMMRQDMMDDYLEEVRRAVERLCRSVADHQDRTRPTSICTKSEPG